MGAPEQADRAESKGGGGAGGRGGGRRRLVPSPEPVEILDRARGTRRWTDGAIVVAAGGGGIPMIRENGGIRGVEAVVDKDLCGALLARRSAPAAC